MSGAFQQYTWTLKCCRAKHIAKQLITGHCVSLSVRELVQTCYDSCKSTALENRATGEKRRLGMKDLDGDQWLEWLKLRDEV